SPEYSHFLCYAEWRTDYRYALDNIMDPMHGTFLHKQSHSMSFGDTQAQFHIRDTPTGFVFEKQAQRNVNFDWAEFGDTGIHWLRLEIPYPATGGPRQFPYRRRHRADRAAALRGGVLALPQGHRLAARYLALPVQESSRATALARA